MPRPMRGAAIAAVLAAQLLATSCAPAPDDSGTPSMASATENPPAFTVDPGWPHEMPDKWILGSITGVFVDSRDHVWVTHLPETLTPEEIGETTDPAIAACCRAAPAVIEFDAEGNVVQGFGWPTDSIAVYPRDPHGIFVDHNDFVWVGTYLHHRVMKFTRDGQWVMTIGRYDENGGSNDTTLLGGPAGIWVDPANNEVYVADGYRNRRVIVFDGETGSYKRHWGAYGERPDDDVDTRATPAGEAPSQFSTVHGLIGSNDGLIYVADRRGNRIQVFQHDGTFVAEKIVAPDTRASGSAFVIAFSPDPEQTWLYLADGTNHRVWTLRRSDLEVVSYFGSGGHQVGHMLRPHGMSVDSHGNLYVGEASTGRRVQKFTAAPGGPNTNPRFGEWKMQSDAPAPAVNLMTYSPYGATGMHILVDNTNAQGEKTTWSYETLFDGIFRPVEGRPGSETAVEIVDAHTTRILTRRDGRVVQVILNTLSEDGNRIDNEYHSYREDGTERVSSAVYERIR